MSRSFTSSSRTALIVVASLAAIELALRVPDVERALPIRTYLHEPGAVVRLEKLEHVRRQYQHIDVLFVGSSVVRCNIQPMQFDALLARSSGSGPVSFNAGLSGMWPAGVRLYLEGLWLAEARPRIVAQGIRYGELFPSRRARAYSDIASSVVESTWDDNRPMARLKAIPYEHLRILQYRGTWPSWLYRFRNGRPAPIVDDEVRIFTDARGWTPRMPTLDITLRRHTLDNERPNGSMSAALAVDALDEIRKSARAAHRAGAEYVLVNMPEHAFRWSGDDGRERYATYLEVLQQLAANEGFEFIDVTGGDPLQFSSALEYSDYHHMSPAGSERFTRLLADEFRRRFGPMLLRRGGGHLIVQR
jgi:hypothetical protein